MARFAGGRNPAMCAFKRSGRSSASASTLTVQSKSKYLPPFFTCSHTLMNTSVLVRVEVPVSQLPDADFHEWNTSLPSHAKMLALCILANFINCTSGESGKIAMKQYSAVPATGSPSAAAGTEYSVRPPPTKVPFQPAGSGTSMAIHVEICFVCTQPVKASSFSRQLKPMLQQSCSLTQDFPAHAQPGSKTDRLPSCLHAQSLLSSPPQEGMQVA
mmetsp:Transcript_17137/g.48725  ORF Transcript_17137/g.48725 Transcript_17137/m.48725 type:complete len:215 (-) Transcript_17137:162-806(-)